jgi:CRP-like cAMP-binding protein
MVTSGWSKGRCTTGRSCCVGETHVIEDTPSAAGTSAGVSRRLYGLLQDVAGYALNTGMERVIGYLLRDQDPAHGGRGQSFTVCLPVSMATIASRLSLTPEYFLRVLHELESAELIEVGRREIRIRDTGRLTAYRPAR